MKTSPFCLALALLCLSAIGVWSAPQKLLLGDEEDRILILAPHPDDEAIAAGGLIQEAVDLDIPVKVCFLTMGDNNELAFLFTRKHPVVMPGAVRKMGEVRQQEALAAAEQLGLTDSDLVFLGYPDFGTLDIWRNHWRDRPPFRSMLTRVTAVPYDHVLTPGAAYSGEDILNDLTTVIRDFRPTLLVLPHPADHNVDHRALYLFARVALWNLAAERIRPSLLAYPVHFTRWPAPRRFHPASPSQPPAFLQNELPWREYTLASFQVSNKLSAIRRHHSQYLYSAAYLDSFARKSEVFGDFPDIRLPDASGEASLDETDDSQFDGDPDWLGELSQNDSAWDRIEAQCQEEAEDLGNADNEFSHRSVSCDGVMLTFTFRFSRPVTRSLLRLRIYGWRADTPFADMPKASLEISRGKVASFLDLNRKLPADEVECRTPSSEEISISIPLEYLGEPEKLLTAATLAKGELPIDWVSWRAVDLTDGDRRASSRRGKSTDSKAPKKSKSDNAESAVSEPTEPAPAPVAVTSPAPAPTPAPAPKLKLKPRVRPPAPTPSPRPAREADEVIYW